MDSMRIIAITLHMSTFTVIYKADMSIVLKMFAFIVSTCICVYSGKATRNELK